VTSPALSIPSKAAGRIIATLPARGGIGATTLSVNLAESLAAPRGFGRSRTRAKVALVDLDLQFGSVGSMLDLPEHDALARLAGEGTLPDVTFLRQAMLDHPSGLRVMPAPSTFVPQDALGVAQVAAIIDVLRTEFDYVVIDLPHAVARWIEPVISAADMVLLVADLSVPVVRQGRRLTELLTADNPALPLRLVASREDKPMFRTSTMREAERALERPVWAWLPPDQKHARAAADQGRPLRAVGGVLSKAINRLARQVERELATPSAVAKGV
jgi:Flp pilus assembly CpaE family ATPase